MLKTVVLHNIFVETDMFQDSQMNRKVQKNSIYFVML